MDTYSVALNPDKIPKMSADYHKELIIKDSEESLKNQIFLFCIRAKDTLKVF